ncbi:alkaline shock response membrane anchor protein AmaP [Gorillibacterium sp. sgz5001074]|uniref:alkaline shock response membrane anchor protein AmaP n=1 Tax=Gorillibacterium sp. sgz5001074 TaxID=3446695 RepID=UPI003F676B40
MAKIIDRLLLFLFSLAILVATCCMLAASFNWIPQDVTQDFIEKVYTDTRTAIAFIAGCAVLILISIRLFYISVRSVNAMPPSFDQRNELGALKVSVDTIENLALKAASRIRGVKDLRARVGAGHAGIEITIRSVVDGETSIPAMTEEMQNAVKQQIEEITGFPVASVSVFIANVAQSTPTFKSRVE